MNLSHYRKISVCLMACVVYSHGVIVFADESDDKDSMTHIAKVAQKIQAKIVPMVQVPLSYNYNQNREPNQNYTQGQFQFGPMLPIMMGADTGFILNPMLTDNINRQNQQTSNQTTPLQLATYLASQTANFVYGIGPFIQMPTASPSNGSQQTGLGVSYGLLYQPKHWVVGAIAYNAWGVGNNLSAGTANLYYVNPTISYTTNNAWTFNLQSWINGNPAAGHSNNTNQLMLSGGNTFKTGKMHWQWQLGPSYMVTNTPTSPQGWGGYFSLTLAFPENE